MLRLFVALELPPAVQARLSQHQAALKHLLPDVPVTWASAESAHLTLTFLGKQPATKLAFIRQGVDFACRRLPPFALETAGLGAFPSLRRPSVLWTGVRDDSGALQQLHRALTAQLGGLSSAEQRAFTPHLTLGRVKRFGAGETVREALAATPAAEGVRWGVDGVTLFSSVLSPAGPRYEALHRALLKEDTPPP